MRWILLRTVHELASLIQAIGQLQQHTEQAERLYAQMRDAHGHARSNGQKTPEEQDRPQAPSSVEPRRVRSVRAGLPRPADV